MSRFALLVTWSLAACTTSPTQPIAAGAPAAESGGAGRAAPAGAPGMVATPNAPGLAGQTGSKPPPSADAGRALNASDDAGPSEEDAGLSPPNDAGCRD